MFAQTNQQDSECMKKRLESIPMNQMNALDMM